MTQPPWGWPQARVKTLSNANNECMKTNPVNHRKAKAAGNAETIMRRKGAVLGLLFLVVMIGASGCADYYGGGPYYGDGPYYAGARTYGPGYGPAYAAYPGSVTVAVGDRPYYRGPGYWSRGVYYVWRPGHWRWRHGQRVWIRGHYVLRG
jgi:WXXGXW repeat (2 copies)